MHPRSRASCLRELFFVFCCGLSIIRQTSPSDAHKSAELNKVYHIMLIPFALTLYLWLFILLFVSQIFYSQKIQNILCLSSSLHSDTEQLTDDLSARCPIFYTQPSEGSLSLFTWKRCGCGGWINACLPALSMEFALTFVKTQEIFGFCKFCNLIRGHKRINAMGKNAQLFVVAQETKFAEVQLRRMRHEASCDGFRKGSSLS